jgi:hypothetical protein
MTAHHSVEGPLFILLVLAHLQAIGVAWALALAIARGLPRVYPGAAAPAWGWPSRHSG